MAMHKALASHALLFAAIHITHVCGDGGSDRTSTNTSQANLTSGGRAGDGASATTNLANTLFITFFAVAMGFTCVRLGFIVPARGDMRALGFFIGQVAFPLLVFRTVATAQFGEVDMMTILACLLGKLVVLVLTWASAYLAYKSDRPMGQRWLTATVFSFFATSSNDFAIGMPVVEALYEGQHMMVYIAANALVNAVLFTPLAMVNLAIGKNLGEKEPEKTGSGTSLPAPSTPMVVLAVAREIILNPVILMTISGILFKLCLGFTIQVDSKGNAVLPSPLKELVDLITGPFGMCALFLTGTSLEAPRFQMWPVFLVVMKVVLCAWASYAFAVVLVQSPPLTLAVEERYTNFSFLYGMIPTSSAPLLFAREFDPSATELMATAILFGLILSGPLMFGAAVVLEGVKDFPDLLVTVELQAACISLVAGLILIIVLLILRQQWGYECPYRCVIMGVMLTSTMMEFITLLMNPTISEEPCKVYNHDPWSSHYGIVLNVLQDSMRVLVLLLACMALSGRTPPKSWRSGLAMVGASLIVSLTFALFTVPNTIAEMCQQVRMGSEDVAHVFTAPVGNVIFDTVFLALFVIVGLMWVVCGDADGSEDENESEEEGTEEGLPRAEMKRSIIVKTWLSKPPKSVLQGLVFTQVVLIFLQLVNTFVVIKGVSIEGSFQMMLLLEMILQHGFPVTILLLLVSNVSFCAHFMSALRETAPWLFGFFTTEEEMEGVVSHATGGSMLSATGHIGIVGMHRLSSLAEGFVHPEDFRRASMVSRKSTAG